MDNMQSKSEKTEKKIIQNPYKISEYDAFISLVESGVPIESWSNIAEDLGVSKDTITDWKRTERYKIARAAILSNAIANMTDVGKTDWRMWDRYTKLLGIDAVERRDITSGGKVIPILGGATNEISEDNSNNETTESEKED